MKRVDRYNTFFLLIFPEVFFTIIIEPCTYSRFYEWKFQNNWLICHLNEIIIFSPSLPIIKYTAIRTYIFHLGHHSGFLQEFFSRKCALEIIIIIIFDKKTSDKLLLISNWFSERCDDR